MSAPNDASGLVGGPITRHGGKGVNAPRLLPHFAPARVYAEPCFGAGGMFFRIPEGTYEREAVNDLDRSLVTFFRVLRDRPDDLARVVAATPYAREEFVACLTRSDDELEEARRVWVRSRQGFAGKASTAGDWGRNPGGCNGAPWLPSVAESKRASLPLYAARLRRVAIDCVDAVDFVERWGLAGTMVYADPPYVAGTRSGDCYEHEMDDGHHRRLAAALRGAADKGAKVAVSGYPSALYDELFAGWRTVEMDVALVGARDATAQRRTEVLWCSYPREQSFAGIAAAQTNARQPSLFMGAATGPAPATDRLTTPRARRPA